MNKHVHPLFQTILNTLLSNKNGGNMRCVCRYEECHVCRGLHGSLPFSGSEAAIVLGEYKGHWVGLCEPCSRQWTNRPNVQFKSLEEA